ncbi:cytochrome c3 family protein [Glacieibacterium frigidum]|uniref:Cytochrome C n=1 Tax=Glacieibacterium frigidum TaxID=2593303 RepID=A0A552U9D8_9SPHN|nr:cytochrome c3 family protein [Glacieibacterium frigidum]TRW14836.1 cytochrome C [Glacieibacterium frigidum]
MSIILRQITRRAGGGEIARTSTLDKTEVLIGRGTDCDVQIPDLAVMLRHARLHRLASGRVALDALGGVPLNIGGRFVERGEIDPASGARVVLGSHVLTIAAGDTADDIVVTVERTDAPGDAAAARDEARTFGLDAVMPGKRPMVWLSLVAVLAVFLAWPIWASLQPRPAATPATPTVQRVNFAPDQLWTSGPLSAAHANLSNDCGACHDKAFVSVRDETCRACHDKLPDHAPLNRMQAARAAPAGLFGEAKAKLDAATHLTVGRCASCHKEHEGPDGALMVASTFCSDCHAGLKGRLNTALSNVAGFDTHPQFRATIVSTPAAKNPLLTRVSLDAKPRENSGLKFPHKLHLAADGGVARMASEQGQGARLDCADCHTPDADGVRFVGVDMEKNCASCHDLAFARDRSGVVRTLPHGRPEQVVGIMRDFYRAQGGPSTFVDRRRPGIVRTVAGGSAGARGDAAVRAVFSRGGACFDCHAVTPPSRAGALDFGIAPVSLADHYLPKGQFPHKRHTAVKCESCHAAATSSTASDVLLPGVASCRECHGKVTAGATVPATCDTCHGYHEGPATGALPVGHPLPKPVKVAAREVRRRGAA